jgi:hypothetical protein
LIRLEREIKALNLNWAFTTDALCFRDLQKRLAGRSDGEEELWIGVATCREISPGVVGVTESQAGRED